LLSGNGTCAVTKSQTNIENVKKYYMNAFMLIFFSKATNPAVGVFVETVNIYPLMNNTISCMTN
jgi:hypothetical protein